MANVISNISATSFCQDTKIDIIRDAYTKLRINGFTSAPDTEELELALNRLENLMQELKVGRNVCLNYNFEQSPDPNSVSNLIPGTIDGVGWLLASRIAADFNKEPGPGFSQSLRASYSSISGISANANMRGVDYPQRMPIGSGNYRYPRWYRFYQPAQLPPADCSTNDIKIGETRSYTQDYCNELLDDETIISYTIEVSQGLSYDNDELDANVINYDITANSQASEGQWQIVRFTITTDNARTLIDDVNFNVTQPDNLSVY